MDRPDRPGPARVSRRRQQGIVLIIALLILLTLTLLSSAAMQTALLEEKIATNSRLHNQAFQQAEAALRAGESWLLENDSLSTIGETFATEQFRITLLDRRHDRLGASSYGEQNNAKNDYFLVENQPSDDASGAQIALRSIYAKRY